MTGSHENGPQILNSESLAITSDALRNDNFSEKADGLRHQWEENRSRENLWAIAACGDARILIPNPTNTVSIRSIATAGIKESKIIESAGVKIAIALTHVDGATIQEGKRPTGCGGLGAKEEALNGDAKKDVVRGIEYYVTNKIQHPDATIQSRISAEEMAAKTGKPALAAVQDHRSGKIYPIAAFLKGGLVVVSKVREKDLIVYSEKEIYRNGIPSLEDNQVPDEFTEFLQACKTQERELLMRYPNLKDMQKVQNPRMVVLSTDIRSMKVRYPTISDFPGLIFKLHVPREKIGSGINIQADALEQSLSQTQYPIGYSVRNYGQPDKPFSKTDLILIETGDIAISRLLAAKLMDEEWMKQWLALSNRHIIVIQTQEGISNVIEQVA